MMVYTHAPLAAKSTLMVNVSGVGSPQQAADAAADQGGQGAMPQEGNSRSGPQQDIQAVPGRLDSLKWPIIIGFIALFGLGAVVLSKKQIVVARVPGEGEEDEGSVRMSDRATQKKSKGSPAPVGTTTVGPPAGASSSAIAGSVAAVNAEVNVSLDALKDSIFRLELRRQAGTISEEDYARERAQMEKTLRDLVRG